jgi:hypothetical protein
MLGISLGRKYSRNWCYSLMVIKAKTIALAGALVRIRPVQGVGSNVCEVLHYGTLTRQTCSEIRSRVAPHFSDADAVVIRLDMAMDMVTTPPLIRRELFPCAVPPGVIVISAAQRMDLWQRHAANLARIGVIRSIFLSTELADAYEYADQVSVVKYRHRRDCHPSISGSDFAPLEGT